MSRACEPCRVCFQIGWSLFSDITCLAGLDASRRWVTLCSHSPGYWSKAREHHICRRLNHVSPVCADDYTETRWKVISKIGTLQWQNRITTYLWHVLILSKSWRPLISNVSIWKNAGSGPRPAKYRWLISSSLISCSSVSVCECVCGYN